MKHFCGVGFPSAAADWTKPQNSQGVSVKGQRDLDTWQKIFSNYDFIHEYVFIIWLIISGCFLGTDETKQSNTPLNQGTNSYWLSFGKTFIDMFDSVAEAVSKYISWDYNNVSNWMELILPGKALEMAPTISRERVGD